MKATFFSFWELQGHAATDDLWVAVQIVPTCSPKSSGNEETQALDQLQRGAPPGRRIAFA